MEQGLTLDPLNMNLKLQLDATTNSILKDLLEGRPTAHLSGHAVCTLGFSAYPVTRAPMVCVASPYIYEPCHAEHLSHPSSLWLPHCSCHHILAVYGGR